MKRSILLILILLIVIACAEDEFRPAWMMAYPLAISDTQGLLVSWDVQNFEYDLYTNTEELGIMVATEAASTIKIMNVASTNVTYMSNLVLLTNGLNLVELEIGRAGYFPSKYSLRIILTMPTKDTRIASLSVSPGTLTPAFTMLGTNYSVIVDVDVAAIDFTVDTVLPNPDLFINGSPAGKGVPFTVSGLAYKDNLIPVRIVSEDLSRTNTIMVNVYRLPIVPLATVRAEGIITHSLPRYAEGIAIVSGRSAQNAYIQQLGQNVGINLRSSSGTYGFSTGDYIRVKYTSTADYNGLLQMNVNPADVLVYESGRAGDLVYTTITATPAAGDQGKYVRITNCIFASTLGDGANRPSPIYIRNESGAPINAGTYTLYGHVGQYNADTQVMVYDQPLQVVP